MKDFVSHFKLAPMIKFGQRVKEVKWNEEGITWKISTETGSDFEGDFFISAVGLLSVPQYPDIKVMQELVIHSANPQPQPGSDHYFHTWCPLVLRHFPKSRNPNQFSSENSDRYSLWVWARRS